MIVRAGFLEINSVKILMNALKVRMNAMLRDRTVRIHMVPTLATVFLVMNQRIVQHVVILMNVFLL